MNYSKVINIQDVSKYPDNYDWLNNNEITKILGYMNGIQALANRYYEHYVNELTEHLDLPEYELEVVKKDKERYLRLYNHTITSLTGSKNGYATLGIMCEYDWPNHEKTWFLATKADAEYYNDFQETEVDNEIDNIASQLLSYGDVGI